MTTPGKALWANGPAANAWQHLPGTYLSELLASAGADVVTLDMQHGMIDISAAKNSILAIEARGAIPFARLPREDPVLIGHLLDAGAQGLICPTVESAEQAQAFTAACYYPPIGRRSFGPNRARLSIGSDYFKISHQRIMTFAMIETLAGLEAVEEIARHPHLTGLFVGPGDLGISMGLPPGQDRKEKQLVAAIAHVAEVARSHGKRLGIHARTAEYATTMALEGFDLVTVVSDTASITSQASAALSVFRQALARQP